MGSTTIEYSDALMLVDVDSYWRELDELLTTLKRPLAQNLAVRSVNGLDNLMVTFEGDEFPIKEIAAISKKDPKQIVLDCSSFPQSVPDILKAIENSGMGIRPQQDKDRIFVPVPKITREYRENLA